METFLKRQYLVLPSLGACTFWDLPVHCCFLFSIVLPHNVEVREKVCKITKTDEKIRIVNILEIAETHVMKCKFASVSWPC